MKQSNFTTGDWVKFSSHEMEIIGEVVKPLHERAGEEGEFFTIKLLKPRMEMSFRRDKIRGLKKIEAPLIAE